MRIEDVKYDERGLVPAIVQDARTGEVLTLAYMNALSLKRTLDEGETWFWSRSRGELWHKGATSGNRQRVLDVKVDCDGDALVVLVEPFGPACHTGARSCFESSGAEGLSVEEPGDGAQDENGVDAGPIATGPIVAGPISEGRAGSENLGSTLQALYALVAERRAERPEGSYTTYLFTEGLDKILKKVGEEAAETIIAAKNEEPGRLVSEVSDLVYHLIVLLVERGVGLEDVRAELWRRRRGAK